jgi:hypothetical protein
MTDKKVKVLITGPVNNDFESFVSKLDTLSNSKAGPFDICFCVGPFFGNKASGNTSTNNSNIDNEKINNDNGNDETGRDEKAVNTDGDYEKAQAFLKKGTSLPVYFCDIGILPNGIDIPLYDTDPEDIKDNNEILLDDEEDEKREKAEKDHDNSDQKTTPKEFLEIAKNVYYLRGICYESMPTADIININIANDEKNYLTVAFLPPNARTGTKQTSNFQSKATNPSFVGCDILLTSAWGQGMAGSSCLSSHDRAKLKEHCDDKLNLNDIGTFDVAEATSVCRPRYHFAPAGAAIPNGQTDDGYNASFFMQSLQYKNPMSALSSGVIKNYHTSRFLALCQVVDAKTAKAGGKGKKFIHALGIQPLWCMDRITATKIPENVAVASSPYTDAAYQKDGINEAEGHFGHSSGVQRNVGLSEAQTRRILCEETSQEQYRWKVNKRKREQNTIDDVVDPTNYTLFLHGLQKDVSRGANLNRHSILSTFQPHGCVRVRYPGNDMDTGIHGRPHSYCFLEFSSHTQASECLMKTNGIIDIEGIRLSLKWSSGNKHKSGNIPPPPPPGFVGVMIPSDGDHGRKRQKIGMKEAEALDSTSLFIHLEAKWSTEQYNETFEEIRAIAQTKLEDAINGDSEERVTADEEPALKVTYQSLVSMPHCGFLLFASHAAASMALATLTSSTDGGNLLNEFSNENEQLKEAQLWWGRKSTHESINQDKRYNSPLNARTDCWFCLASPTCEKHLIVSLSNNSYITMPKGPINIHHTLVVPINHSSSGNPEDSADKNIIGAFLDPNADEIEETIAKIRQHASTKLEKDLYVFERAIPTKQGYHSHVNCVPIERGMGQKIRDTMLSIAATKCKFGNGFELCEIQNPDISINTVLKNSDNLDGYFYAEIPFFGGDNKRLLYKYNSNDTTTKFVPLQFGREVLAAVVGDPNIASWKTCILTQEQEEVSATEYRQSYGA